jgi:hypothetical protein
MQFFVLSGSTMARDEEGLCSGGQDAKELATDVKVGGLGKGGAIYSDGIWIHQGWFNQLLGVQRT